MSSQSCAQSVHSDSSSVSVWLDGLPEFPEGCYGAEQEKSPQTSKRRKRTHNQHLIPIPENDTVSTEKGIEETRKQQSQQSSSKRRRLREISSNSMEPPTPARKSKRLLAMVPSDPPKDEFAVPTFRHPRSSRQADQDPDQTPKPKRKLGKIPHLPARTDDFDNSESQTIPSSPSKSTSTHESIEFASNKSSRARSPVKTIGDFNLSDIQIELKAFRTDDIPSSAKNICKDLKWIGAGRWVIPMALKDKAMSYLEDECLIDLNFAPEVDKYEIVGKGYERSLSADEVWEQVQDILQAALECQDCHLPESSWNSEVHSRIFRLALRGYWMSKGITYRDVTTAKITDKSLLPINASGSILQSKMVDYSLVIKPSAAMAEKIRSKLGAEGRGSINHTAAEYIRFDPIAISVETKRAAIAEDTAHAQLGLWVAAHFARLRQLTLSQDQLPILPLLIVQGPEWKLMVAEQTSYGNIVILRDLVLGSTRSVLGIYQILSAIGRLAEWVDHDYRSWFEENAL